MDLEAVFRDLGQFGRYQVYQYALLALPLIASSFEELSYIFTSSQVEHRCLVPECEPVDTTVFYPAWLPNAVPYNSVTREPKWCDRYATKHLLPNHTSSNCSSSHFLHNLTLQCHQWVFASKEITAATKFKLFCENNVWQRTLVGTVNNVGLITNYLIICYLSDKYGRKTTLICLSFAQGLLTLLQSVAPTYSTFLILEYLVCFCSTYNTTFILGIEAIGGDKHKFANCLMNSLYSVGEIVLAMLMWWFQDFKMLLRIIGVIKLVNVLCLGFVSESVHWYLTKDRFKNVVHIVKRIAHFNRKQISEDIKQNLDTLNAKPDKDKESVPTVTTRSVIKELLHSPPLLRSFAVCSITWLLNVFVYFGFSLMSVTIAGNKYFNFALLAIVEIPAYVTMWISMEYCKIRHKTALQLTSFLTSVPCLVYLFVPTESAVTRLCLFLLGKFAITVAYTVVYEVGVELFPTELRQSMMGLCCAIACIGGLFAPQIPLLALYFDPMALFLCLSIAAGCLSYLLPEPHGVGLPDTIKQTLNIVK